ncbi:MAG: DUF4190 domain-containing protein [Myxococcaceae bacterium]
MKVYCPNCGQANDTGPGARVMCTACTAVFDAPPEAGAPPPAPPPPEQSWDQPAPPPAYAPPTPVYVPPVAPVQPSWAPPSPSYGTPAQMGGVQVTNTLAIISLIAGIVCCIPVVSPLTAIITGVIAISQINADPVTQKGKGLAVAGIVLGSMSVVLSLLSLIGNLAGASSNY